MRTFTTSGPRFWLRVALPIALGTFIGLRACVGDTSSAQAIDHFSSTNRCLVLNRWADCPEPEASLDFTGTFKVSQESTYDPKLDYFHLNASGKSFMVMLDRDLPLAAYLRDHDGERVALTLAAPGR